MFLRARASAKWPGNGTRHGLQTTGSEGMDITYGAARADAAAQRRAWSSTRAIVGPGTGRQ